MAVNCRYYLPSPSKTPGEFSVKKGQDTVPFGETWQDRKVIGFKHPVNHDKTERAWLGRRTREKTGKGNQIIPLRFQTKGEHQTSLSFLWASEPRKTPAVLQCTQTMFSACCVESRVTSQPGRNTCTITLCTQKHLQYYTMHTHTHNAFSLLHRIHSSFIQFYCCSVHLFQATRTNWQGWCRTLISMMQVDERRWGPCCPCKWHQCVPNTAVRSIVSALSARATEFGDDLCPVVAQPEISVHDNGVSARPVF